MSENNWRPIPENPDYQLSNSGRLRGPRGLCIPNVQQRGLPRSARYAMPKADGSRRFLVVTQAMKSIWEGVDFKPTHEWIKAVRADVMEDRAARLKARYAKAERVPATLPEIEEWRALPEEPRYELSNHGRMRGPKGLLSPYVKINGKPRSALYMIKSWAACKTTALVIHKGMLRIWGLDFEPTREWVAKIKGEANATRVRRAPVLKAVTSKPKRAEDADPSARRCKDCGKVLTAGYWYRCADCWILVRRGIDMPLEEYSTCSSNGRR